MAGRGGGELERKAGAPLNCAAFFPVSRVGLGCVKRAGASVLLACGGWGGAACGGCCARGGGGGSSAAVKASVPALGAKGLSWRGRRGAGVGDEGRNRGRGREAVVEVVVDGDVWVSLRRLEVW